VNRIVRNSSTNTVQDFGENSAGQTDRQAAAGLL